MSEYQPLSKKEADRLMQLPCKTRGEEIFELGEEIREKYGKKGIISIQDKLSEWGHPVDYHAIKFIEWYPEGLNVLLLVAAAESLHLTGEEIFELGHRMPKISLGAKIYIKYLLSPTKTFQQTPFFWRKFVTCGEIEPYKIDEEKRFCLIRLKDYEFHPVMCQFFRGYFLGIVENTVRSNEIIIEETACVYNGDLFHEYLIKW